MSLALQKLAEWLTLAVGNLPHDSGLSATSQQLNEFKDGVIAYGFGLFALLIQIFPNNMNSITKTSRIQLTRIRLMTPILCLI